MIDNLYDGNTDGGELRVANGSTMTVNDGEIDSDGLITLEGPNARFNGGPIYNYRNHRRLRAGLRHRLQRGNRPRQRGASSTFSGP